ncbi:MAG: hypothetical protein Q9220_003507 [cf. Caloplaca sp. 1 TL-2023]
MIDSDNPPPADIDAMLQDVSNQMARSQLFRRLSTNSNNSSPSRKGNTRVAKAHSNSATPQGVQRRRTTTAYTCRTRPTATHPARPHQPLFKQPAPNGQSLKYRNPSSAIRPMTWHPGLYPGEESTEQGFLNDLSGIHPNSSYDTQDSYSSQDYLPQSSYDATLPLGAQQQYRDAFHTTLPDTSWDSGYDDSSNLNQTSGQTTNFFQQDTHTLYDYDPFYASFAVPDFSQLQPDLANYTTQQTPDFFPSHYPSQQPQYIQTPVVPQINKQKSKELFGMGLYDGPSRKELSGLNASPDHIDQLLAEPQGKGLKLEETWQPPNEESNDAEEEEEDAEEEGYSTDEAEEDFPPAPPTAEVQPTFIPAYHDLSNKSFFFENDDPYTNFMSLDQGVEVCQTNPSTLSTQNCMWF